MTASPPFMSDAPTPHTVSPSMRGSALVARWHGVEVAGQDQPVVPPEGRAGDDVVAHPFDVEPGAAGEHLVDGVGDLRLLAADRRHRHQVDRGCQQVRHGGSGAGAVLTQHLR